MESERALKSSFRSKQSPKKQKATVDNVVSYDQAEPKYTEKEEKLFKACEIGNIDQVYNCLWSNANVNAKLPHSGASPLSTACQNGHMQIASLLIEFGAVIKASDSYGCTPLHWAANSGHPKLVQMLMNKGKLTQQDLSKKDNFGSTPLHFASVRNMLDTVGILLQAGSDPYQTNNDGRKSSDLTTDESIKQMLLEEESKIVQKKLRNAGKTDEEVRQHSMTSLPRQSIVSDTIPTEAPSPDKSMPQLPKAGSRLTVKEFAFGSTKKTSKAKKK